MKDSSVSVVRHRHRRHGRKGAGARFLVVLLFVATAAITWQFSRQQPVSSMAYTSPENGIKLGAADSTTLPSPSYSSLLQSRPGRPAYLYSVVPGGIASAEELRQAMENDPVVAQQFAGFDFQKAHLVQVSGNQSMHVAYRMGQKVYWTRKKLPLHSGETLSPPAISEPAEGDLDQPLFSNVMVTRAVDPQPETYAAAIPVDPPAVANAVQPTKRKRMIPFFILPFFGLPGGSSHTPLAVTPEPGMLLLLSSGLAGVYWKTRKSRRKP